jgi:hypothetical protein
MTGDPCRVDVSLQSPSPEERKVVSLRVFLPQPSRIAGFTVIEVAF